jgi:predicted acetyltransferase
MDTVKPLLRQPFANEFDSVYMMGFEAWNEGKSEEDYLLMCRNSPKYKTGRWYVFAEEKKLLSSLIVYRFDQNVFGFGSIATPALLRKQGFATKIISEMINKIEAENTNPTIFLYSDIDPAFYEKFGFLKIPSAVQRYKTTVCMVRSQKIEEYFTEMSASPEYF